MAALLCLYLTLLILLPFSSPFTPTDNYLLNCGSAANTTLDHRVFVGDSTRFLTGGQSVSLSAPNPSPTSPALYNTARVFKTSSTYRFRIKNNGTHLVRLHFSPFQAQKFDLKSASFGVSVNGFSLLGDFSTNITVLKEFILSIDGDAVEIVFSLAKDSFFGFVNAIEVFSAPSELILDVGAKLVTASGTVEYNNLTSQVLETIHRINVGGSKLTPFNDTLWRTWIPDDDYLVLKSAAKRVSTFDPPNYQGGGSTREVAPDNVYMTAQEMNSENSSISSRFNISWNFPVTGGVRHLVRLHFCDIVSKSLHELYFDVYINGYPAYVNLDLSTLTFNLLASPYYIDFVVDSDSSGFVSVSVGPSDLSSSMRINAVLNGAEIMKMVNSVDQRTAGKRKSIWIILGSVLGGFVLVSVLVLLILLCRRRRKPKSRPPESVGWTPLRMYGGSSNSRTSAVTATTSPGTSNLKIPFTDLMSATNNFDKSLIVGSGGFGMVYKGVLRDNTKIAVKRGVPGSRQGLPEFQTEITVLSKIRHRHLVALVGYCEEQSEMILVYEYMEKGSLKNHLYGSDLPPLTWKQRLEICIGAARGLHYLHTGSAQGIIHRDIKSTNILLDESYVAKVADFGLSRAGPCLDESHVSTAVKGSFGYLDPEYFRRQQLTDKSDVYSFGVVLFEVLCARPAVDPLLAREQVNLGEWAMMWHKKGLLEQIVDPCLAGEIKPSSLKKFGDTAEKCLAEYGVDRPSMGDVLWNLEHVLQLQENGQQRETMQKEDGDVVGGQPSSGANRRPGEDDEEGDGDSELTGSQVFSQLINNEGR